MLNHAHYKLVLIDVMTPFKLPRKAKNLTAQTQFKACLYHKWFQSYLDEWKALAGWMWPWGRQLMFTDV